MTLKERFGFQQRCIFLFPPPQKKKCGRKIKPACMPMSCHKSQLLILSTSMQGARFALWHHDPCFVTPSWIFMGWGMREGQVQKHVLWCHQGWEGARLKAFFGWLCSFKDAPGYLLSSVVPLLVPFFLGAPKPFYMRIYKTALQLCAMGLAESESWTTSSWFLPRLLYSWSWSKTSFLPLLLELVSSLLFISETPASPSFLTPRFQPPLQVFQKEGWLDACSAPPHGNYSDIFPCNH